jgi:hypothetical protein
MEINGTQVCAYATVIAGPLLILAYSPADVQKFLPHCPVCFAAQQSYVAHTVCDNTWNHLLVLYVLSHETRLAGFDKHVQVSPLTSLGGLVDVRMGNSDLQKPRRKNVETK